MSTCTSHYRAVSTEEQRSPGGMHRRSNAAGLLPTGCQPRRAVMGWLVTQRRATARVRGSPGSAKVPVPLVLVRRQGGGDFRTPAETIHQQSACPCHGARMRPSPGWEGRQLDRLDRCPGHERVRCGASYAVGSAAARAGFSLALVPPWCGALYGAAPAAGRQRHTP